MSHKTDVPGQNSQSSDGLRTRQHKLLLLALIVIFLLSASGTLLLGYMVFKPQVTAIFQLLTRASNPTDTPQCIRPTLTLGGYIYPLQSIALSNDGTLPLIPGPPGTAWWVSDTSSPFVLIFDPASRSLDLKSVLSPGDQMEIQWADCGREEFVFTDFQSGIPDFQSMLQNGDEDIDVIVQPVGTEKGYVLRGKRPE